ncbi:Ankyrin repeat-containing protein [Glarea lozoyensis ATCC 20868]|uniref:Ankyrin repeat-containing protein n=1 Tax=Glarea lozoyensis (strain ATCC 20868 / MF5171) TaxID=1116229 RepID=S3DAA8_GLAL2|nr:Ankyrin repeat-containing protein [Glarea lozoyensis ATCC 20868]EPE34665.1 Ankyrin repeat-containing protein [Glarea lozoyensis ATCC 20868]
MKSKCHQVLRTTDYESHKGRNPGHVEGTCQWFLQHAHYTNWLTCASSSFLLVSALPGCGKSVLSKLLVDCEIKTTAARTVCYFFFKEDSEDQKYLSKALCALLHQLFQHKPKLLSHATKFYDQNASTLQTGEEDTGQIQRETNLVIDHKIVNLQKQYELSQDIITELREELGKVEHRTYLWLKLIFNLLSTDAHSLTKKGRRKIFGSIPQSVNAAYTAILNKSKDKEQAKKLLQIVCVASRPLSFNEMIIVLTLEEGDTIDDQEVYSEEHAKSLINDLCGLFVTVINGYVYFLHQTAKEFLLGSGEVLNQPTTNSWVWESSISIKDSHHGLAHACIWYLQLALKADLLAPFNDATSDLYPEIRRRLLEQHFFLDYAFKNWFKHFREAEIPRGHPSVIIAIELYTSALDGCGTSPWLYVFKLGDDFPGYSSLHFASDFGHLGVLDHLVEEPKLEINKGGTEGRTPLHIAVEAGNLTAIDRLLSVPNVNLNVAEWSGETTLYFAIGGGQDEGGQGVIAQLLSAPGLDVNAITDCGYTALLFVTK